MPLNAMDKERLQVLESVVKQSYNSIMITTPDVNKPKVLYVNPAFTRVTGYSLEQIKGKNPKILQGPLTNRKVIERLKTSIANGEYFQGNTTNYRKDRTPYYVEWNITPIKSDSGEIIYFLSIQHDISNRIIQEKELKLTISMYQTLFKKLPKAALAEVENSRLFQKFKHLFVKKELPQAQQETTPPMVVYDFILADDLVQIKDINHDISNIMDEVYISGMSSNNLKALASNILKLNQVIGHYSEILPIHHYLNKIYDIINTQSDKILEADEGIISILSALFRDLDRWREVTFETGCISLDYMYSSFESDINTFTAMLLNDNEEEFDEDIFF